MGHEIFLSKSPLLARKSAKAVPTFLQKEHRNLEN
jgi:hypothetical protein